MHDMLSAMVFLAPVGRAPTRFTHMIHTRFEHMQTELPEGQISKYDYFLTLGHEVDWVVNMVSWLHQ